MATSKIKAIGREHEFGTDVTITTTNYTAPSDGIFIINTTNSNGQYCYGFVNDQLTIVAMGGNQAYAHTAIPVRAGMRLRIQASNGGGIFRPYA